MILSAIQGGVTMLQVRDKKTCHTELVARVLELQTLIGDKKVKIIVNDIPVKEADGIHLGQSDMNPIRARELLGPDAILGITIDTLQDFPNIMNQHRHAQFDYISPLIHESKSKPSPSHHLFRLAGLQELVAKLDQEARCGVLPPMPAVLAISGVNLGNVRSIIKHGADGVAVIGAIKDAADPLLSTQMLCNAAVSL